MPVLCEFAFHSLALRDILAEVDVADELTRTVEAWVADVLDPAVVTVCGAQAVLDPVRLATREMALVATQTPLAISRIDRIDVRGPAGRDLLGQRTAGKRQPRLVEGVRRAVDARSSDACQSAIGKRAVVLLAFL